MASALIEEALRMEADASWRLRCLTIMPDHLHLFLTLGTRLTLSQCISRLKRVRVGWQDNFYDHCLRASDSVEATIRYIWMNPYQAKLIKAGEVWPHFYCCTDDWAWFSGLTHQGLPFPEWLREA
jgi:REP element-mobilizing transposase RayT